jgi:hypothetical protein
LEEDEEVVAMAPSLRGILDVLTRLQDRVKKVMVSEQRTRREEPQKAVELLQEVRRNLDAASETLEQLEGKGRKMGLRPRQDRKKKEKKRVREEEEEDGNEALKPHTQFGRGKRAVRARKPAVEESNDEEVDREKGKKSQSKLHDGSPCLAVADKQETLVYFALMNERMNKAFECPLLSEKKGTLLIQRKFLEPVELASLSEGENVLYLSQLEADIVKRFEINVPVLFNDKGGVMMDMMCILNGDPTEERVAAMFDSLSKDTIASRQLSAANNMVLMLAAKLHAMLAASNAQDWYASFKRQIAVFCKSCLMKVSTVERYQSVGALMLRSKVLACMLPSFVALNVSAIEQLLNDQDVVQRWQTLCQEKLSIMLEIGEEEKRGQRDNANSIFSESDAVDPDKDYRTASSNAPAIEELLLGEENLSSKQLVRDDGLEDLLYLIADPYSY